MSDRMKMDEEKINKIIAKQKKKEYTNKQIFFLFYISTVMKYILNN